MADLSEQPQAGTPGGQPEDGAPGTPWPRIAIVSHSHPSLSKGGAEIAAYTLFTGLLALGVDAIFITACAEHDRARLMLGSRREHAVFHDPAYYDHFYQAALPAVTEGLCAIIARERVDVVNFHHFLHYGIGAVRALAAMPGLRTVLTLHEFLSICRHHGQMITRPALLLCERASPVACATCYPENTRQQFAMRQQLFHAAFAEVDAFISPSHFLAQRYAAWGLPADSIAVVENGLAHRPAVQPRRARPAKAPWVFGFFGQINPFKGLATVLDAVELIARKPALAQQVRVRVHGHVIGQSTHFTERFNALVEKHQLLSYAGPYDNARVADLMSECDYILVPSIWWENSPVVIQEAYAVGRPVICTGIGGMAEKVRDGVSGLHFRLSDESDLVRAMVAAADPATFARLVGGIPAVGDALDMARAYLGVLGSPTPTASPAAARVRPAAKQSPMG